MSGQQLRCIFLIPILRNSDRKPHRPLIWDALRTTLVETFQGSTGPEIVLEHRNPRPGAWKDSEGKVVEDESRAYTVIIAASRLEELRAIMRKAASSFDQECIYLEFSPVDVEFIAGGEDELV